MKIIVILFLTLLLFASCKQDKTSDKPNIKPPVEIDQSGNDKKIDEIIDSIKSFAPIKLSINEEHSDMDHLIPVGYNDHGSLALIIDEDMGGASGTQLNILPTYESFTIKFKFEMDEDPDTLLAKNRKLIYEAFRATNIKIRNTVQRVSIDSMQKLYGIKFESKKTFGPPEPDAASSRKTLTSAEISFHQGESAYPSGLVNSFYSPVYGIYDIYISDCLVIPGEEGLYGFAVIVTESAGFEGYTRKSIELMSLGVVKGN